MSKYKKEMFGVFEVKFVVSFTLIGLNCKIRAGHFFFVKLNLRNTLTKGNRG